MRFALTVAAVAACFAVSTASLYFDIDIYSTPMSKDIWTCMFGKNMNSTIIGAGAEGEIDQNFTMKVDDARAAGAKDVDLYLRPCYKDLFPYSECRHTATEQVQNLYGAIVMNNVKYRYLWLDIDEVVWAKTRLENVQYMEELLNATSRIFKDQFIGIKTSSYGWEKHLGRWKGGCKYRLWWKEWDNFPSFDNFEQFGGWKKPFMKEFTASKDFCGIDMVDVSYTEE